VGTESFFLSPNSEFPYSEQALASLSPDISIYLGIKEQYVSAIMEPGPEGSRRMRKTQEKERSTGPTTKFYAHARTS